MGIKITELPTTAVKDADYIPVANTSDGTRKVLMEDIIDAASTQGGGLPTGGSAGQVLAKRTSANYDTEWVDQSGGGGAVDSVNGKTGVVVLDAEDVGALPNDTTAADLGAYVKPSGGIPASDLASAVQTSLSKADTALQSAPVTSVNGQTGAVSLSIPSTAADVGAAPAVTEVTISTAGAVSQSLDAGKIYHFTGAVSSLTLTLNAAASGQIAQYHFDFESGSTAATVTITGVSWSGGSFVPEASKRYEVDILNGYGVYIAW